MAKTKTYRPTTIFHAMSSGGIALYSGLIDNHAT